MARRRRNPKSNLTTLALIGGIGVVAYGSNFLGIKDAISGGLSGVSASASVGVGGSGGSGGGGGSPCDARFIPGVRYVEFKNGAYNVVIGGQVVFTSGDQGTAEREYNKRVCGG